MKKIINNTIAKEGYMKVLLLTSYCSDNKNCSNDKPCIDCLGMCNTFQVKKGEIEFSNYLGTLEYLRN